MLTIEQQACNNITWHHINRVQHFLNIMVKDLIDRGEKHDQSKLKSPEVEQFTLFTPELSGFTYGTPEYNENKDRLGEALQHHYAKNSHHPEHWKDGVNDMSLLDLCEMFADWRAATERHNDGNILKSIEKNADRFNMSPQLCKIFENTAKLFE